MENALRLLQQFYRSMTFISTNQLRKSSEGNQKKCQQGRILLGRIPHILVVNFGRKQFRVVSPEISSGKFPEIYSNLSEKFIFSENFRKFLLQIGLQYKPSK